MCLNDFTAVNLQPLLYDKYLKTTTVIDSAKHTNYAFIINKDSLSKVADRFTIVYRKFTAPVIFLNIKANVFKINSVAVDWKIKRELGILKYELLKADEADSFKVIATLPAINGTSVATYSFNDLNLTTYNNNYRIKATDLNGVITYSAIVNVKLKKIIGSISLWPNPIVGKTVNLTIQNLIKGNHNYTISNNVGVTVYSGIINNTDGQMITTITLPKSFPTGTYQMSIVNGESIIQSQFVISGK